MKYFKLKRIVTETRKKVQKQYSEIIYSLDLGLYFEPDKNYVAYIFKTDKDFENAKKIGLTEKINKLHKECMENKDYPISLINDCIFASEENCENNYDGNWHFYFK